MPLKLDVIAALPSPLPLLRAAGTSCAASLPACWRSQCGRRPGCPSLT